METSIVDETNLRQYVRNNVENNIEIQWVEPGKYGSSMGAADCNLKCGQRIVSLELKIWKETRNGIKCEMRPVQRRWHHMTMRRGGRTAVLAHIINSFQTNRMILVRGDHIPLRDYSSHPQSGCADGQLIYSSIFLDFSRLLFDESYGFWL
jgi:hypothetical protein